MAIVIAYIHSAEVEGESAPVFGVSFPDFPGVAAGGNSQEEALARSRDALAAHIAALQAERLPVPVPRRIVNGASHWLDPDVVGIAHIDVDLPTKARPVAVTIEEDLLARIDRAAKAAGETRSGFLARAARERLDG